MNQSSTRIAIALLTAVGFSSFGLCTALMAQTAAQPGAQSPATPAAQHATAPPASAKPTPAPGAEVAPSGHAQAAAHPAAASHGPSTFLDMTLNTRVNPCDDFYDYACGVWNKEHPIPPDQAAWGTFSELQQNNQRVLRVLAEYAEHKPNRSRVEQEVGDYYHACMDENAIERAGAAPLKPELARIDAIHNRLELRAVIAYLQRKQNNVAFAIGQTQDYKNANMVIADADQAGLGLPSRSYYLRTDPKSVALRRKYVAHVAKMLELAGTPTAAASQQAEQILNLETSLAKVSMSRTLRRDPKNTYHKMSRAQLQSLTPGFSWTRYLVEIGYPAVTTFNVDNPGFFKGLNQQIQTAPLPVWKAYLRYHAIAHAAPFLSSAFVKENFNFTGRILEGAKQMRPRWKRCIASEDGAIGDALGQMYVQAVFPPSSKAQTLHMVNDLETALQKDISTLPWMSPATRQRAIIKLHAITNKIGYPNKWRNYSSIGIVPNNYFHDAMGADQFEFNRQMRKIGKPVDRQDWEMSPPTVNAYYDPQLNEIVFPAGILQSPFYEKTDLAATYGGIGAVIGHELTHGFDDQGSKFGPHGNMRNWWTPKDRKQFDERTACIVKQYGSYVAVGNTKLNGKLTLGENTADNGGLRIAYMALLSMLAHHPEANQSEAETRGFTPQQRFFLGWAHVWCGNYRPALSRLLARVDPHSPPRARVNETVSNMPEFQQAFHCGPKAPMVRGAQACRVW